MAAVKEINILSEVKKTVESTLKIPADKLDINAGFESFGMDSLIATKLIANLSKKFNISITPAQYSSVNTIKELANYIENNFDTAGDGVTGIQAGRADSFMASPPASGRRPATGRRLAGRMKQAPLAELVDFVRRKFSIDLAPGEFKSIDEIVDVLVSEHAEELLSLYQTSDDSVFTEFGVGASGRAAPSNRSVRQQSCDIAIVGISCRFPDAPDHQAFWKNLLNRKCSIREIPKSRWNWEDYYADSITPQKTISRWGALIDGVNLFDADFFRIPPEHATLMDPQERLLMQEVYKAFQDACIDMGKLSESNTGVFVGYEYAEYEQYLRAHVNGRRDILPLTSSSPTYYLANRLSYVFNLRGPSESININCASSAVAINRAYYSLLNNESDLAAACGVSLNLFVDDYIALTQHGMFSPSGTCAVFDDDADGYTRGEGVGVVVLKRLDDAIRDNNRIYAVIKSCHQNNRGGGNSISDVKHEAITGVIADCHKKASISPETVDYIEVNGYSTKWGDSFEFEGIKNVFNNTGPQQKHCALGSLKGNIGHLEPVNGIAAVIKIALSLHNKRFPATITKKKLNEFIDIKNPSHPLYIADTVIPFENIRRNKSTPVRAGVNSFAISGTGVHILLEEYPAANPAMHEGSPASPQLFIFSARDRSRLENCVHEFIRFLSTDETGVPLADMSYILQTGREAMQQRLAVIASSREELLEKLKLAGSAGMQEQPGLEDRGIYFGNLQNQAREYSLDKFITKDMMRQLVEHYLRTRQWQEIALLWINGAVISWGKAWEGIPVRQTSLPVYPFARNRYWIGDESGEIATAEKNKTGSRGVKQAGPDSKQSHALPRNDIERQLVNIWAEVLNAKPETIGINDGFFEHGGDSLQAMVLISKINARFKQSLPLTVLLGCSNIAALSKLVASGEITSFDILVPIQTAGSKPPIFAIPGAGGNVVSLQQLAQALGESQPFYGLQAVGLDGNTPPLGSVEETAAANIAAIRALRPMGPYALIGYSNGGVVAFEMARMLLEQNEKVSSLILLDSLLPEARTDDENHMIVEMYKHTAQASGASVDLDIEKLQQMSDVDRCEYLYDVMKRDIGLDMARERFAASYAVAMANERSCRFYKPSRLARKIDVTLYRATESYKGAPKDYGWNRLLRSPLGVHAVHANHFSMLDEGPAREIAVKIAASRKSKSKASHVG